MAVIADKVVCAGGNLAVDEFVVIGVVFNEMPEKMYRLKFNVTGRNERVDNMFCHYKIGFLFQFFKIF